MPQTGQAGCSHSRLSNGRVAGSPAARPPRDAMTINRSAASISCCSANFMTSADTALSSAFRRPHAADDISVVPCCEHVAAIPCTEADHGNEAASRIEVIRGDTAQSSACFSRTGARKPSRAAASGNRRERAGRPQIESSSLSGYDVSAGIIFYLSFPDTTWDDAILPTLPSLRR